MDIDCLPPEILSKIFSNLDQTDKCAASAVCKSWHKVATDPWIWKKIIIFPSICQYAPEVFKRFYLLQEIVFAGVASWNWIPFFPEKNCVRKLRFNSCDITTADLKLLIRQLPLIESVDVDDTCHDGRIIDKIVQWPKLEKLNISVTYENLDNGAIVRRLRKICLKNHPCLKKIEFRYKDLFYDYDFFAFSTHVGGKVKSLSLDCYLFYEHSTYEALKSYTSLTSLTLFETEFVTNEDLVHIRELTSLKELRIWSFCRRREMITPTGFENLFKDANFPNLTAVHLKSCNICDNGLEYMVKCCRNLKTLELRLCNKITDLGMVFINTNCKNVENLYLIGLSQIDGSLVKTIPPCLKKLNRLCIDRCPKISAVDLRKLQRKYPCLKFDNALPKIKTLNVFQIEF